MIDYSRCEEYYNQVCEEAARLGMLEQLIEKLVQIGGDKDTVRCVLFKDFAPLSFAFNLERKGKDGEYHHMMNGGLIFHGNHDGNGNGGAPSFSVNTSGESGWQVHT